MQTTNMTLGIRTGFKLPVVVVVVVVVGGRRCKVKKNKTFLSQMSFSHVGIVS